MAESKPWREEARKLPSDRSGQDITINVPSKGLCTKGKKCIRQDKHAGECWPKDA